MPAEFQSLADFLAVPDPVDKERPVTTEPPAADLDPRDFAQGILNSQQYRESLMRRILMDELPPAVEVLLYHYAHGKPPDKVQHGGDPTGVPIQVTRRIIDPASEGGPAFDRPHSMEVH
jgi:hypothetical protein